MSTLKYQKQNSVFKPVGEKEFGISHTMPNMAPPMRQLLERHALGLKDGVMHSDANTYSGDLPDYRGLEPFELQQRIQEQNQIVKELQQESERQALELQQKREEAKQKYDRERWDEYQKTLK